MASGEYYSFEEVHRLLWWWEMNELLDGGKLHYRREGDRLFFLKEDIDLIVARDEAARDIEEARAARRAAPYRGAGEMRFGSGSRVGAAPKAQPDPSPEALEHARRFNEEIRKAAIERRERELLDTPRSEPASPEPETIDPEPGPDPLPSGPSPVRFALSAPRKVGGQQFTVRVAAYIESLEEQVLGQLRQLGGESDRVVGALEPDVPCRWEPGTPVQVRVWAKGFEVEEGQQEFEWSGRKNIAHFILCAQERERGRRQIRCQVCALGVPVLNFVVDIDIRKSNAPMEPVTKVGVPVETAFASYSRKDLPRVLDMALALERFTGIRIFLDRLSLRSGENWKSSIQTAIGSAGTFLLFWSQHSAASEWVDFEWRYALENAGLDQIKVYALSPPSLAPPPTELADLHFDDPITTIRWAGLRTGWFARLRTWLRARVFSARLAKQLSPSL